MSKKVAVIGAGISGTMAAYYLAKKGYKVSVYEAEKYPAMKTSFANGGQLSVSNSEVWNTWANVKKGIKWIFKKDAPLLIRLDFDIKKYIWLAKFLYHTICGDYKTNTITSIKLGLESRKLYREIIEEENIKFDYSNCGIVHFYKNSKYFHSAIKSAEVYMAADAIKEWDVKFAAELRRIEPALQNNDKIVGGIWTPEDSTGDIHIFCNELSKVLKEKHGVRYFFNIDIKSVEDIPESYDYIVVSNGVGSNKLAQSVGDNLGIYPVKGYSITIELDKESAKHAPTTSLLDDEAKIVTARLGNRFRVAGTAELAGENYDIRRDRIEPLLKWVHDNFPKVSTRKYTSWACLRPMTPNMIPIVKQSKKNPKVFYHTGHGHLGWTYSPETARKLAEMM